MSRKRVNKSKFLSYTLLSVCLEQAKKINNKTLIKHYLNKLSERAEFIPTEKLQKDLNYYY